mmetsp:Transcript_11057/g.27872  ORF Transcript_11057/g.27872 Transcript_11057/m.27872 type:complete len:379 (-) Transcript_11057:285-1421(-)
MLNFVSSTAPIASPARTTALSSRHAAFVTAAPLAVKCGSRSTLPALPRPSSQGNSSPIVASASPMKKVVIAGGSGVVGRALVSQLLSLGVPEIVVLTRSPSSAARVLPSASEVSVSGWVPGSDDAATAPWAAAVRGADAVVNLCGELIVTRWSDAKKKEIMDSRVGTTKALVDAIAALPAAERPKCFVGFSAVGYYPCDDSKEFDESSPPPTTPNFLTEVTQAWEAAASGLPTGVRSVTIRSGIVLSRGGGFVAKTEPIFNLFAGGPVGRGTQPVSWVHERDLARLVATAAADAGYVGVYNGTAPRPETFKEVCAAMGRAMGRPSLFPVPGPVIKVVFGEGAMVLLEGQRVMPKRAMEAGFEFEFKDVDSAMKDLFKK